MIGFLSRIRVLTRASLSFAGLAGLLLVSCEGTTPSADDPVARRHLLLVLDGLRPDYVTPYLMPALHALGQQGLLMTRHHAVYPTVTRVNASSLVTGSYPATHGLLGNSVFFAALDPSRFLSTGDRANLLRVEGLEPGRVLTSATLGEVLQAAGERLLVMSAGSSGSSYLLSPTALGGSILHYDYSRPEKLYGQAVERLGAIPEAGTPNHERNRWIVDAFFEVGLPEVNPTVTVMWLSDPDTTAHQHGVGHPTTVEALFRLDAEIQRIYDGLAATGLLDTTNIWITSDHGFSEHTGSVDIESILLPFAGVLEDGSPTVVAGGGAIYVRSDEETTVPAIVRSLQAADGVGAVFTKAAAPGASEGTVAGTLSFDLIQWNHDRSAQVLYSSDWTDRVGEYGFAGTTAQDGTAGHGSSSPYDIHNTLVAVGPDLRETAEIGVPSGNVDFAPTILHLLGLEIPASMTGRVMYEALRGGPAVADVAVETRELRVDNADGSYRLGAVISEVSGHRYLDYTTVERGSAP
ncbi:MAG: alkaline phosphatase family protein [Acidobacteriota bacterium]|nr:alkaline phosphatase family protein [Acidobacteriota bacterium]